MQTYLNDPYLTHHPPVRPTLMDNRQGAVEDGEFLYGTTLFEEMKASLQPQKVEVRASVAMDAAGLQTADVDDRSHHEKHVHVHQMMTL